MAKAIIYSSSLHSNLKIMKTLKFITALVAVLLSATAFSQSGMEDVLYLKNGSIYRGNIIEQIPGESYKVQIAGGSILFLKVGEVEKITKEPTFEGSDRRDAYERSNFPGMPQFYYSSKDTSTKPSYLRQRKFFKSAEFRPGPNTVGLRLVHGYKFGRFGYLGIGFGLDAVAFNNKFGDTKNLFNNTRVNNGLYIPVVISYSGDILRKRITPYYFLEAGYAAHPVNPFVSNNGNKSYGGPTGSAGFGVKFFSKGRVNLALNLNATYRSDIYKSTYTKFDDLGNKYTYTKNGIAGKVFGAFGIAVGF